MSTPSKIPIQEKIAVLARDITSDIDDADARWQRIKQHGIGDKMNGLQDNILKRVVFMCDLLREHPNRKDIGSIVNCYIKNLRPVMVAIVDKIDPKY